tara:strand:- start:1024 stop:1149 length:126 start_codon:yes stop_codon:yes gene_type:complete
MNKNEIEKLVKGGNEIFIAACIVCSAIALAGLIVLIAIIIQ